MEANGGVTVVNSNPSKLTTTSRLGRHNRSMAMFRHGSEMNNLLVCNVPGVGLRGSIVRHGVGVVRRRNMAFRAYSGINGSVGTDRVLGSFSHMVLTYNTSGPESVGIPNERTGNVRFTISFLGSAAGSLLSYGLERNAFVDTGNGGMVMVNNNSANGSYINADVERNTGSILRLRVVPGLPSAEDTSGP